MSSTSQPGLECYRPVKDMGPLCCIVRWNGLIFVSLVLVMVAEPACLKVHKTKDKIPCTFLFSDNLKVELNTTWLSRIGVSDS